jgi:hypothetical protein
MALAFAALVLPVGFRALTRIFVGKALDRGLLALAKIVCGLLEATELVAFAVRTGPEPRATAALVICRLARRRALLLAVSQNDPDVMLGVLQVVLRQYWITGSMRIARQRRILLCDVCGCTAHLDFRSVRLKTASQRVLAFAVIVIIVATAVVIAVVVVPTTPAAMLLSLPHGLPFSH